MMQSRLKLVLIFSVFVGFLLLLFLPILYFKDVEVPSEDTNRKEVDRSAYVQPKFRYTKSVTGKAVVTPKLERNRRLKTLLECSDLTLVTEKYQYGEYWVLKNIIRGDISKTVGCASAVTLVTHADSTYLKHLETLVERWRAPISLALYTPGIEVHHAMQSVQFARNCLNNSALIRDYVSFSLYFSNEYLPYKLPLNEDRAKEWSYKCQSMRSFMFMKHKVYDSNRRRPYPVNIGRNIAQQTVNTHFIFHCDIDLYPSFNFVEQFLDLIDRKNKLAFGRRVFTLPVFEFFANAKFPNTKDELVQMFAAGHANSSRAKMCQRCNQYPEKNGWLSHADNGELIVYSVDKRLENYAYWSPFFVSDRSIPVFDERIKNTYELDRRIQSYALCLLGYDFYTLHPAFLSHKPSNKTIESFVGLITEVNEVIRQKIVPQYRILYGSRETCKV